MPFNNLFPLTASYRRITHTKKVEVGDWFVVKSRRKGRYQTFIQGQLVEFTKTGKLTLEVSPQNGMVVDSGGNLKAPANIRRGCMSYSLQDEGISIWKWLDIWPDAEEPRDLDRHVCYHILRNGDR